VREKLTGTGETEAAYMIRFNDTLQEQKKSMLLFSVPFLALVMSLLYFRSHRYYVEHLIFSIHVYAFLLIALALLALVSMMIVYGAYLMFGSPGAHRADTLGGDGVISIILGSALLTYIYNGLRRAYGDSRLSAAIRAAAVTLVILLLTGFYHDILFYTTYFAT
jgi:hypothetical protein